jgi:carbon-monoxide dehydrogenase large subunit/6-hydroxypseudooxynicotine dehydrogenase subunit gamma
VTEKETGVYDKTDYISGALYEEFRYDGDGQPLSVTFADYLMPTICEIPPIEILMTEDAPSPLNPLGIKSAGEGGITPVGAVIASAIDAAIGIPGGVTQLPMTPQRVKALLRAKAAESGGHDASFETALRTSSGGR